MKHKRRVLLVNNYVQLKIILFAAVFSAASALFAIATNNLFRTQYETGEQVPFSRIAIMYGAGCMILVSLMIVGFVLTNQICGPIFRIHRQIRDALAGKKPEPLRLRPGDDFSEVADDLNALIEMWHSKK